MTVLDDECASMQKQKQALEAKVDRANAHYGRLRRQVLKDRRLVKMGKLPEEDDFELRY